MHGRITVHNPGFYAGTFVFRTGGLVIDKTLWHAKRKKIETHYQVLTEYAHGRNRIPNYSVGVFPPGVEIEGKAGQWYWGCAEQFFFLFYIPFIILALLFSPSLPPSLPPSSNSDPGSHSGPSSPVPLRYAPSFLSREEFSVSFPRRLASDCRQYSGLINAAWAWTRDQEAWT